MASELKSYAKSFGKSAFVSDRRDRISQKDPESSLPPAVSPAQNKSEELPVLPPDIFSELGFSPEDSPPAGRK
jgi:hypothetical protein